MNKSLRNLLKSLLCMTLIVTLSLGTPFSYLDNVLAEETETTVEELVAPDTIIETTEVPEDNEVKIGEGLIEEYEEKREQNVKHFYREDGLVEAVYYPYSVHYNKDGVWTDIDNSLVEKTINGVTVYENTANSFKISFSKENDTDNLVSLNNDGSKLSWAIPEMDYSNPVIETVSDSTDDIRFQNKLFSKITYKDAINGLDVTYMLTPDGVREYFIIESEEELESFNDITIVMKTDGLDVSQSDNKLNMKKDGDDKFTLSEPVMFDSTSEFVSAVPFEVKEITGKGERQNIVEQAKEMDASAQNYNSNTTTPVPSELPSDVDTYSPIEKDTYDEFADETEVSKDIATKIAEKEKLRKEAPKATKEAEELKLVTAIPTAEVTEMPLETPIAENKITERNLGDSVQVASLETEVEITETEITEEPIALATEGIEQVVTEEPISDYTETPEQELIESEEPTVSVEPTVSATEEAVVIEEATDKTSLYVSEVEELISDDEDVNYFTYTIELDKESIKEADITYPLIIDPDITADDSVSNMLDTFVSEKYPTTNYGNIERLKIGYGSLSGINRSYMKLASLPQLSNGDMVVGAKLYMIRYWDENTEGFDYDRQINLHKVTADWDQNTMTWNTKKAYDTTVISSDFSHYIDQNSEGVSYINEFDITKLVKEWYNDPSTNYGMMLKNANETDGYHEYRSVDQWDEDVLHQVVDIVYVNSTGIESTYSYHELSIGRAGTAYINDATGNATLIHSDCSSTDGKMPIQLSHVFDNNYRGKNIGYGVGWRLNYDQTVEAVTINNNSYYKYVDGDGTIHYYYKDGSVYYDEGNKKNKLTISGSNVIIEDTAAHMKYTFVNGKLNTIADANGNTITIKRNSSGYISEIIDPEYNVATLEYSDNLLDKITCPNGEVIDYNYWYNFLTEIVYPDTKKSTYAYYEWCMGWAEDIDGYKVVFDYDSLTKLQVNKVTEYADEVAYNHLTFAYKTLLTTVTDNRGRSNHYRFNKYGQLINEQDYDGSAVYYDYETSTPGKKDNLNAASDILSTAINLIANSSFESNENNITSAWQFESESANSLMQLNSSDSYIGDCSLQLFKSGTGISKVYTTENITPGKTYTFSLYYQGTMDAYMFAEYTDASGNTVTEDKKLIRIAATWNKNTLTVKIPSDAGSTLKVGVVEKGTTTVGFGNIDAVQLAENGTSSRYNLIKNPDFTNDAGCWGLSNITSSEGCVTLTEGSEYKPDNLNDKVFKIIGSVNVGKSIYQNVSESGEANDSYIAGVYVKSEGIPKFTHTNHGATSANTYGVSLMRVEFFNGDTLVNQVNKLFSYDTSDWQYVSFNAKATGTFTRIKVSLHFARNLNNAYFDGVSLYKDGYGTAYTYDSSNNLQKIETKEGKTYLYEYYENNDLKKSTDEYGDVIKYEYDANHNVTKTISIPKDTSISYITEYTYDDDGHGNVTSVTSYDSRDTTKKYVSYTEYLNDNNYKSEDIDSRNNSVEYSYDYCGRLERVTDSKDSVIYNYDLYNKLYSVGTNATNGYVGYNYSGDNLSKIILSSKTSGIRFCYGFSYNTFGQLTDTYVENQLLSTNTYDNNKRLTETTYGNGFRRRYSYNGKDQLSEIIDAESYIIADYRYNDDGYLSELYDEELQRETMYDYDDEGRLIRELSEYTGIYGETDSEVAYVYDERDRVDLASYNVGGYSWNVNYEYDDTNHLYENTTSSDGSIAKTTYDCIGRIDERTMGNDSAVVMDYAYEAGAQSNSVTTLVNYFYATGQTAKRYTYDETGLITKIAAVDGDVGYSYDERSQLNAVVDNRTDTGKLYTYDDGGNITKKTIINNLNSTSDKEEIIYTYDSTWDDLLISYDGQSIEYDAIGNPTKYLEYDELSWNGRNLEYIMDGTTYVGLYAYDIDGLRRSKYVGNKKTEYIYTDGQLSAMKVGNDMLYFTYDANGTLISVKYNDVVYYYIINPQGDVVGLCTESGASAATYSYDEWGNHIIESNVGIGALNPFRYRGYIYDAETGFYLTGTRYYDPEVGRFINADDTAYLGCNGDLNSYNLFAYCGNNPVNRKDINGNFWVNALIGAAVNVTTTFIAAKVTGQEYTIKDATVAALSGAVNSFGIWGKIASGVISGVYAGIMSYQSGANIGEVIACSTASGIAASLSIGNIAYFSDVVVDTATSVAVDLVFGTAYNTLAAATYKGITNNAQVRNRNQNNTNSVLANKSSVPTPQKAPWKTKTYVYSYGVRI